MQLIKRLIKVLLPIIFLTQTISCTKNSTQNGNPIKYADRVAQDSSYRKGKWYSISNGAGYNFTINPLTDTVWFISDSVAGWTNCGGNPYLFCTTYFNGPYYLIRISPDILNPSKIDTVIIQCGMTLTGDTFALYRVTSDFGVFPEEFLKLKD